MNIKSIRKEKKLTVKQLAQMLNISQSYMTRIENGQRDISLELAMKISSSLNVSISSLFLSSSYSSIEDARKDIDVVDKEMALLFSKRMDIVSHILELKKKGNISITDSSREQIVINKNKLLVPDEYSYYYTELIKKEIELSKEYQNKKNQ